MQRVVTLIVFFSCAIPWIAEAAQPSSSPVEGVVIQAADGELIIDLGRRSGLPPDAEVKIYRKLQVVHPVTGETLVDRFPIGTIKLSRVGDTLSIANRWSKLEEEPKAGDFVVWPAKEVQPATKRPPKPSEVVTPNQNSPTNTPLDEAFANTLGEPISNRIETWKRFLEQHPESPHLDAVAREIVWLRELRNAGTDIGAARQQLEATNEQEPTSSEQGELGVDGEVFGPGIARTDLPINIVAVIRQPSRVQLVRLLIRGDDQVAYSTLPLEKSGQYAWRTTLGEEWQNPGRLQYFVEAVRTDGTRQTLGGIEVTRVDAPVEDPVRTSDRSRATATFDYVNFSAGEETDEFFRIESDYRYQLDFGPLTAFSVGVGIFDGRGASVEALEAGVEATELNLAYGFAETEIGITEFVGIAGRLLIGNRQSSSAQSLSSSLGGHVEARIGEVDGTRLGLGVALTEGIGAEAWIDLAIDAIDRVPMVGEVMVTNLPVGADLGVSLNYGVGYQFTDSFSLMARFGWNARTIDHHGPSVGIGTALEW